MKKPTVILLFVLLLIVAAVVAALWLQHRANAPQEGEETNKNATNSVIYFDDETPEADPLMLGRWVCADKQQWHKVYYDDYEDGMFWGKEWDESDDVMEEDLSYHGNGWFRWTKNKDTLFEYHTMDLTEVPIAHRYKIRINDSTDIEQLEIAHRSHYHFVKQ